MSEAAWRFPSAFARLRAAPSMVLAPLIHMLMSGFFLSHGFLISCRRHAKAGRA